MVEVGRFVARKLHFALLLFVGAAFSSSWWHSASATPSRSIRSEPVLLRGAPLLLEQASNEPVEEVRSLQESPWELQCTQLTCLEEYPEVCVESENDWVDAIPTAFQYVLIAVLLMLSALFSGLTLGLMGLDKTGLEIVMEGDDEANAAAASRIYPVRSNGNLLLCTLLLGNVAVNALLSILLADISGGTLGFLLSTFLIVIFGEILPQAACARYALAIGSRAVPLVKVIIVLLYPVAAPMAWVLNRVLGNELATTYSSAEMRKLLEIHVKEGRFDQETAGAMAGALKYKEIEVREVMTPIDNTFMLRVDEKLNFETIAKIFKSGYSRIPVYEITKNNIIGLLFVKDLIFIDPEDETSVRSFVQIFGRGAHVVWPTDKLGDVLRELKQGRSHMALVRDVNNEDESKDPFYEIKGIVTLEDILEEIIGDEIVDETDAFVDGSHSVKVNRMEQFDWGRLRLLDTKIVDETLSFDETRAVTAHLRTNFGETFHALTENQLTRLVAETSVTELPTAELDFGAALPDKLMYEKGNEIDHCTLLLSGKVTVIAGADKFRSDLSSWTVLGISALSNPSYKPDFTAFVSSGPCRCLRFTKDRFQEAVDASVVERRMNPFEIGNIPSHYSKTVSESEVGSDGAEPQALDGYGGSPGRPQTRATKTQVRRNRMIAAFRNSGRHLESHTIEPVSEETPSAKTSESRGVEFGVNLNAVLTDGGSYQPKPNKSDDNRIQQGVQMSTRRNSVEYLGPSTHDRSVSS